MAMRYRKRKPYRRDGDEDDANEPLLADGTLTRLVAQKKDLNRISLFIDGQFAFGIHQDVMIAHPLAKGQHLTVADQEALRRADAVLRAKTKALDMLGRKARTTKEIRDKLRQTGFADDVADDVIARFLDLGYLDDHAYATQYVRTRFRVKGYGPQRLRQELYKRGVPREVIDEVMADETEEFDLVEAARAHAEKRWPSLVAREPDARKRQRKLTDFLVRRGFSFDVIRAVLDELEEP